MWGIIKRSIVFILGITFIFALCIIAAKHAADRAIQAHGVASSADGRQGAHTSSAAVEPR